MKNTFKKGDWVVTKLSFGLHILQREVDGTFDGRTILRHPTQEDWKTIELTIWNGGRKAFEGKRADYPGDHSIFGDIIEK
jgi:hypothetical protein